MQPDFVAQRPDKLQGLLSGFGGGAIEIRPQEDKPRGTDVLLRLQFCEAHRLVQAEIDVMAENNAAG